MLQKVKEGRHLLLSCSMAKICKNYELCSALQNAPSLAMMNQQLLTAKRQICAWSKFNSM
jgi:hypothetical protein